MKERVKEYLRISRITQREFCDAIGVVHSYLSSVNKDIPQKKIMKIREAYPDLNIEWLVTGRGEMLNISPKSEDVEKELSVTQLYKDNMRMAEEIGRLKAELNFIKSKL